jgi:hypothetical protein
MSLAATLRVSAALVEKTVTTADGTEHTLHFAKVSALEWTQHQFAMAGGDQTDRARSSMRLLMLSLRDPDGSQALQWDDVVMLDPGVAQQCISHAIEVCRPSEKAGKA